VIARPAEKKPWLTAESSKLGRPRLLSRTPPKTRTLQTSSRVDNRLRFYICGRDQGQGARPPRPSIFQTKHGARNARGRFFVDSGLGPTKQKGYFRTSAPTGAREDWKRTTAGRATDKGPGLFRSRLAFLTAGSSDKSKALKRHCSQDHGVCLPAGGCRGPADTRPGRGGGGRIRWTGRNVVCPCWSPTAGSQQGRGRSIQPAQDHRQCVFWKRDPSGAGPCHSIDRPENYCEGRGVCYVPEKTGSRQRLACPKRRCCWGGRAGLAPTGP